MKVLMVSINQEKLPLAVAPIGAAGMVSVLEAHGHDAGFVDLCFSGRRMRPLTKALNRLKPDVVGISIRNLDDCSFSTRQSFYQRARKVVQTIKKRSAATVVIGGSGVSVLPGELAEYLDVPYAFIGEGENSFPAFLEAHGHGRRTDDIPGLLSRQHQDCRLNPPDFSGRPDDYPLYAFSRIDYKTYSRHGGLIGYQTKRGCTFQCVYCNYKTLEGSTFRFRSPGRCVDDMEKLARDTGLTRFFFTDGVFNWPPGHAHRICEEIVRRNLAIQWIAYCNPLGLDRETAGLFKASGCAGVELGLDAVTDKMLANMKKGFKGHDIRKAYAALEGAGLPFAAFLLFGGPGDTYADMEETQRALKSFGKANAVFASLGIRIYRDAPIYDIAVREGLITESTPLLEPVYYVSPQLGEDMMGRLDRLARREPTWSTPTDWNSLLVKMVQRVLNRFGVVPNWKDIEAYGAHMRRTC